jgi:DNA-binding transcriptional ArsR family regulator
MLAKRPLAVGELADYFPISRPAVSQHLRVLRNARLVISRQEGTKNIYQVNPEGIEALRNYLESMWNRVLSDFKTAAESSYRQARRDKS